jgi:hypothetical protein
MMANEEMNRRLASINSSTSLEPALASLVNGGFTVKDGRVFLSAFLAIRELPSKRMKLDATGEEVFINSFHTDDYISADFLSQSVEFCLAIDGEWKRHSHFGYKSTLRLVVAATDYGTNIKLFSVRKDEPYLLENLEEYPQPIFVFDVDSVGNRT